jgi:CelD/BcsL family acetyltransferase involved in cellulose biosynthesis
VWTTPHNVLAYSPVERGLAKLRQGDRWGAMTSIAKDTGKTEAQVALNWCIAKKEVLPIPRSNSVEHVMENKERRGGNYRLSRLRFSNEASSLPEKWKLPFDLRRGAFGPGNTLMNHFPKNGTVMDASPQQHEPTTPRISPPIVRVVHELGGLEGLRSQWENLLARVPTASTFCTWEWLSAWWVAYGANRELTTLAFFDSERLVAMAPLAFDRCRVAGGWSVRRVRLMGDGSGDSDNLDFLVLPGCEEFVVEIVLDYLADHAGRWDLAQFNTFTDDSSIPPQLSPALRRRGWTWCCHQQPGIVIDLSGRWEDYVARLSPGGRHRVRKHLRRLTQDGDFQVRRSAESRISYDLPTFFDLHQRGWEARGEPGSLSSHDRRKFYTELAPLLARRGSLELWFLEIKGVPAAAEFDFRYGDTVYNLQAAFDPVHSDVSPGNMLRSFLLHHFVSAGVRHYDFLGDNSAHKLRWGGNVRQYRDIHFAIPRTPGATYLGISATFRREKIRIRSHVPPGLWASARRLKRKFWS